MKKIIILATMAAFALAAVSCGSGAKSENGPTKMAEEMNGYVKKGDYEKAVKFWFDNMAGAEDEVTAQQKQEMDQYISVFADKIKAEVDKKGGVKKVEVLSQTIAEDGQSAEVVVETTYGDGTVESETSDFILQDGAWKFKGMGDK